MWTIEQIHKNLDGRCAGYETGVDGLRGTLWKNNIQFGFVFSYGGGWEHLSVSTRKRTPAWEEMCWFKDIFWRPDECCVQYHPPGSSYVNNHEHCLHIWRPIGIEIPTPPRCFV
jgi:hypothetical protein